MQKDFESLGDVRAELSEIYRLVKQNMIIMPRAKDLAILLKTIASVIRSEAEMDIEAELAAIRAEIAALTTKGASE